MQALETQVNSFLVTIFFFGMKSRAFQILPMMPQNQKHLQYATFPVCRN